MSARVQKQPGTPTPCPGQIAVLTVAENLAAIMALPDAQDLARALGQHNRSDDMTTILETWLGRRLGAGIDGFPIAQIPGLVGELLDCLDAYAPAHGASKANRSVGTNPLKAQIKVSRETR